MEVELKQEPRETNDLPSTQCNIDTSCRMHVEPNYMDYESLNGRTKSKRENLLSRLKRKQEFSLLRTAEKYASPIIADTNADN